MMPLGRKDQSSTRQWDDGPGCEATQANPKKLDRFEISALKVNFLILECKG